MSTTIINPPSSSLFLPLVLLATLLPLVLASSCTQRCYTTPNLCKICLQVCGQGSNKTSSFSSCSQNLPSSLTTSSQLSVNNTVSYDRDECEQECCASSISQFEIPHLSVCQSKSENKTVFFIIIASISFLGVVFCCVVTANQTIRQKVLECICQKCFNSQKNQIHPQVHPEMSMAGSLDKIQVEVKQAQPLEKKDVCSICLNDSCNVRSYCQHSFHIMCLREWLMRKKQCPLCKHSKSHMVTLHCSQCYAPQNKAIDIITTPKLKCLEYKHYVCGGCIGKTNRK